MFVATIKISTLRDVLKVVNPIVSEMKITAIVDGLSIRVVDPGSVSMAAIELSKEAFETYKSTGVELGIDLERLKEIVGIGKDSENMEMELDPETNKLKCRIGQVTRRMGLIDATAIFTPRLPDIKPPALVKLATEDLAKGLKACSQVSGLVRVQVSEKGLQLSGESATDTVIMYLPVDQLIAHECKGGLYKSKFSHDFLYWANRAVPATVPVRLEVGTDYPLIMRWEIAGGHGSVIYMIAPRVEED